MAKWRLKIPPFSQVRDSFSISWRLLKLIATVRPGLLAGSIIFVLLPAILPFINIYIYKLIIDLVVQSVTQNTVNFTPFFWLIGCRVATYYVQEISYKLQNYFEHLLWLAFPPTLSQLILGKLSQLDLQYFEDSTFKNLLEKVDESYKYRTLNLVTYILFSFQSFLQLVIAMVAITQVHWGLLAAIVVAAVAEFVYQITRADVSWGIWSEYSPYRTKFRYLSHLLQEAQSFKEIKIFQLGSYFLDEVIAIQRKWFEETKTIANKNLVVGSGFSLISTLVTIGVEVFIIFQALLKRVTIGDIGFYTGVVGNFQNGLTGFFRNLGRVFEESLYVKSIFELADLPPLVKQSANPQFLQLKTAPTIEFKNVSFTYPGASKPTLKNFSLTIQPGEKVAFVGENGAGKSTIIKLLARFYDVDEGAILINGIDLREVDKENWHQHIGVLFQDFNQYQHTVKENIVFGRVNVAHQDEDMKKAAKSSGASMVIEKLEKKYEQVLGKTFEEGVELSTGQWQKVSLARAFFRNAPILVLDEPTAAIDAKAESEIFSSVEKLSKDKTVIIISHRFSTVRNADKIYVIEEGKISESGSHAQLMKKKGTYAELFTLQAKGYL